MYAKSSPLGVDPRSIAQVGAVAGLGRAGLGWGGLASGMWPGLSLFPHPAIYFPSDLVACPPVHRSFSCCFPHPAPFFPPFFLCALQRIMEIRAQIAREWVEELREVSEENALLMRETVLTSFGMADMQVVMPAQVSRAACTGGWWLLGCGGRGRQMQMVVPAQVRLLGRGGACGGLGHCGEVGCCVEPQTGWLGPACA